ncbi:S-type pyocin domain-containing protein [Pseudomonas sp. H1h]|uniref:S-type pyocin domain-containing protein n=1 Tax=Pseudomonas sp. H1h TaxID=1397280 RepID=UPI00046AE82F|nr:S-type pyocin domain-containing protein [Pseudomonas sp. H1h]
MQNPPKPPNTSRPGFLEIDTALEIKGVAPDHMRPGPRTSNDNRAGPIGHGVSAYNQNLQKIRTTNQVLEQDYQNRLGQLPNAIESELATVRSEGATHPLAPVQSIIRELGVLHTLAQRKANEFHRKTVTAHEFYGGDPFNRHVNEFMVKATTMEKWPGPNGIAMQALQRSLQAANDARVAAHVLQSLNQRTTDLQNTLAMLQAAEQSRLAAERIAAEQARIQAQAKAQAEALAQLQARENARPAALAQTQERAAEQARIAAQAAARQAAQEQARLAALAEAERQAELLRTEAERLKLDRQLATLEIRSVFPASAIATSVPSFAIAATAITLSPEKGLAIQTALRSAVQIVTAASTAALGSALLGFAALLMPSRLGNGERFVMSVPLAELTMENTETLREIADRQGSVDLPVGLGFRSIGSGTEMFAVTTDGFDLHTDVPVLSADYNGQSDLYQIAIPGSPDDFLTWTPAVTPDNSSTLLPSAETPITPYSGASIIPIEGRLDLHPIVVEGWERFIIVFPDDSGIAPLYVVFSSPYEGATVKGKFSGRAFNPEQAGGSILDLDWRATAITRKGIDAVKLHTARLSQSDANDIMIERLEKILGGYWEITDTDLRYYTHEIRELERYRVFGYSDETSPSDQSPIWNNAHTATLEDYKLGSELTLLYTEGAMNAMNMQDQREYEKDIRSFGQ